MYLRGVMWEFKDDQRVLSSFLRILKIVLKYMFLPLFALNVVTTLLYWGLSAQIIFDRQVLFSFIIVTVLPIASTVIHETCHLIEWCALLPGTTYRIIALPAQFKVRILFYDQDTHVYHIIKTLYAGSIGTLLCLTPVLIISLAGHWPLEFSLGICIFLFFNLYILFFGGDGKRIRAIAKANELSILQHIRLILYTVLEIIGYIVKKKDK